MYAQQKGTVDEEESTKMLAKSWLKFYAKADLIFAQVLFLSA